MTTGVKGIFKVFPYNPADICRQILASRTNKILNQK